MVVEVVRWGPMVEEVVEVVVGGGGDGRQG